MELKILFSQSFAVPLRYNQNTYLMDTLMNMTTEEIYLDWVNNFVTAEGMANHYGVKLSVFEPFLKSVVSLRREIYG